MCTSTNIHARPWDLFVPGMWDRSFFPRGRTASCRRLRGLEGLFSAGEGSSLESTDGRVIRGMCFGMMIHLLLVEVRRKGTCAVLSW